MEIDKIIITNLPSFYKVNLFNRISEKEKLFVVFTGNTQEMRNLDFFKKELIKFDYIDLKERSSFLRFFYIIKLIFFSKYKELILIGWDEFLLWTANILSPKKKNAIVVESSIYDSKVDGLKSFLKKIFLININKAYASGISQIQLLQALGFSGTIKKTKGVGLFNIQPQPVFESKTTVIDFLYVGRLSPEKNLQKLIEVFNLLPHLKLNIVGFGLQESYLKSIASDNIIFHGSIDNKNLFKLYRKYDVFILPSIIEPWGLVVEEALNNGIPVIVSNRVGCAEEIIINNYNGLIFDLEQENALSDAILKIKNLEFYNILRENVSKMDFGKIAEEQVNVYFDKS